MRPFSLPIHLTRLCWSYVGCAGLTLKLSATEHGFFWMYVQPSRRNHTALRHVSDHHFLTFVVVDWIGSLRQRWQSAMQVILVFTACWSPHSYSPKLILDKLFSHKKATFHENEFRCRSSSAELDDLFGIFFDHFLCFNMRQILCKSYMGKKIGSNDSEPYIFWLRLLAQRPSM